MKVLYVASEIPYPSGLGGARRVYQTVRTFNRVGDRAMGFTAAEQKVPLYSNLDIPLYRHYFYDPIFKIREFISRILTKRKGVGVGDSTGSIDYCQYNAPKELSFRKKVRQLLRNTFPFPKLIRIIPGLFDILKVIRKEKIDVIIERGGSYGLGFIAAKLTNRLYFVDFIDIQYWDLALKHADGVFSYYVKGHIPKYIPRDKISILKTTVNPEEYHILVNRDEIRSEFGILPDDVMLIYVGSMLPWHGLEEFVQAMPEILTKAPNVKALLLGSGEMLEILRQKVKENNLQSHIIIPGKVPFDKVPLYLKSADIALSLNTNAGLGFKNIEYMAAGIPQLCVSLDILPYFIRHLKEGFLIPEANPRLIAESIVKLAQDRELRDQLKESGIRKVDRDHTWEGHIKTMKCAILIAVKHKLGKN